MVRNVKFNNFREFKKYFYPILLRQGAIDINRSLNVLWLQACNKPTFRKEPLMLEILNCEGEIEKFITSINIDKEAEDAKLASHNYLNSTRHVNLEDKTINRVFGFMDRQFKMKNIKFKPLNRNETFDKSVKNTSSSYPDFIRPKGENFNNVWKQIESMLSSGDFSYFDDLLVPTSWRVQVSRSGKLKFRLFYPLPHVIQICELSLFGGFFNHFERCKLTPYVFSNTHNELSKRWLCLQEFSHILAFDYSSFDQTISNDVLSLLFRYIRSHIMLNDKEQLMFLAIVKYHMTAKILTGIAGKPTLYRKNRGLLSGSVLTNLMGSFVNFFVIHYSWISLFNALPQSTHFHGDDNLIGTNDPTIADKLTEYVMHTFGMELSKEKSEIFKRGENVYFLGHYFNSSERLLNEDRLNKQLCISSNYISKEIMSTEMRIISKLFSLLSKCSDGEKFFDTLRPRILNTLNINTLPTTFIRLFDVGRDYTVGNVHGIWSVWRDQ